MSFCWLCPLRLPQDPDPSPRHNIHCRLQVQVRGGEHFPLHVALDESFHPGALVS